MAMRIAAAEVHAALANNILRLILMPTEACNFRCTYCYEDFEAGRMEAAVVHGVKQFLSRRAAELDSLTLSWFGGEPLLARDVVEDIMAHAGRLAAANPRLELHADVTTNGYLLTPRVASRLLDLGVDSYQVSLDGPPQAHDRTRVRAGGGPTFARIWANLLAMRQSGREFRVVVRLHVHGANAASLPGFLDDYARAFAGDSRFVLFFKEVVPLGGPCDATFPFLEKAQRWATLEALQRRAQERGIPCLDAEAPGVCYAARGNAFVVRADGRLNKCTVALSHPANEVGRIEPDGRLRLVPAAMQHWMRGLWSGDEGELGCPMRGLAEPGAGKVVLQLAG
jgi:uncharacterized protein